MKILQEYNLNELKEQMDLKGVKRFRAEQIYSFAQNYAPIEEMSNLPKELREELSKEYTSTPVTIFKTLESKDGTIKFLFKLQDDNIVEGVLMRYKYGNTICISTQVGCRMGCVFCASGVDGRVRDLTAGEMVSEVLVVNKYLGGGLKDERQITNIVLMGSGEPLDNFDNVVKFVNLISKIERKVMF